MTDDPELIPFDPHAAFPEFYTNALIRALSTESRWTVSGQVHDDQPGQGDHSATRKATRKAPVDMRCLIDQGRVRGAWSVDDECLVTLDELTHELPNAANAAYYLRSAFDGVIILDIESSCPPDVAAHLLSLPGVLYEELSMSGNGYHRVFPLPANMSMFPVLEGKPKIQHPQGWYEILFDHWLTFTRRPITTRPVRQQPSEHDDALAELPSINAVLEQLAKLARVSTASGRTVRTVGEIPSIPDATAIVDATLRGVEGRLKSVDDFHGDASRYEFSVLGVLYREMLRHLIARIGAGLRFSQSDRAWLLYLASVEVLEPRAKHHEFRNNRPYLLDRAAAMIASHTR